MSANLQRLYDGAPERGLLRYNALRRIVKERIQWGEPLERGVSMAETENMIRNRIAELRIAEGIREEQEELEARPRFELEEDVIAEVARERWNSGPVPVEEFIEAARDLPDGDAFSTETQYTKEGLFEEFNRYSSGEALALAESEPMDLMSVGDAFWVMAWALEFARENGVKIQLYVDETTKDVRDAEGNVIDEQFSSNNVSSILITENTDVQTLKTKSYEIMVNSVFFYDGEIRSDKRGDFQFRFVVFDEDLSTKDIPIYVKAGVTNCLLEIVKDSIRTVARGKSYKLSFSKIEEKLGDKGFDIRETSKYFGNLPFDFEFCDRHTTIHVANSKLNREKRHDIKKLRILIEDEHARALDLTRSYVQKEQYYIGDGVPSSIDELRKNADKLIAFGERYGLDITARKSMFPFIIGEKQILKTYWGEDALTPTSENVKRLLSSAKRTVGNNHKHLNYEKYWRRARLRPVTYRAEDWNRHTHTKLDITRAHLQAFKSVKIPYDTLEHYNLDLDKKESRELVDKLSNVYGFAHCDYDEFPGAFSYIWRASEVWELETVKKLAKEGLYPTKISYIMMTRKFHTYENFDSEFVESLPKGEFNSMIGALFKRRNVRTQTVNCAQDYRILLAHLNAQRFKIIKNEKTGVKCPLDSNLRNHASSDIKSLFLSDSQHTPGLTEEYYEQRSIEYKVPGDNKPRGLPALQSAITNAIAFAMCQLENYMTNKGLTVSGIWGDGITYRRPETCDCSTNNSLLELAEADGESVTYLSCDVCREGSGDISLQEAEEVTGYVFKTEEIPSENEHLVKTIPMTQKVWRKPLPLVDACGTKFIYDIETILELSNLLLEGPGGSGKTYFLQGLAAELDNIVITSSKQKTARDIGGRTVHKLCSYMKVTKSSAKNSKKKEVGGWSVHSIKNRDYALQEASYIVLDECYVSPAECTDKVIDSEAIVFYTGDKLQKSLIGERFYDLPAKYSELGRGLTLLNFNANMRFKTAEDEPHEAHYRMMNDLRALIGSEQDPERIRVDPERPARGLAEKNAKMEAFVRDWVKKYSLDSRRYNVRSAKELLQGLDKNSLTVLAATNDFVDDWNSKVSPVIEVGSKVITQECKENGHIGIVSRFCGGKYRDTPKELVLLTLNDSSSAELTEKKVRLANLKLAYSMTIDKSQGSTFSGDVVLDCRKLKDLRSLYVGLSRCRYPDRLTLFTRR